MSYGAALLAALGPLVSGRCWPDAFPQPADAPVWPAIRYIITGGSIAADACGSGDPETDDVSVQVDAVAQTADARDALVAQVRTALASFTPPAVLDSPPLHAWDPETRTYRGIVLFTIFGSSTT